MTALDLPAIRALHAGITPGPWFREYSDVITSDPDPRDVEEGYEDARNLRVVRAAPHLNHKDPQGISNAAFIAAAPSIVTQLLAKVEAVLAVEPIKHGVDHDARFANGYNAAIAGIRAALTGEGQ